MGVDLAQLAGNTVVFSHKECVQHGENLGGQTIRIAGNVDKVEDTDDTVDADVTVCSLTLGSPARKQYTSSLGRMQPSSGSSS